MVIGNGLIATSLSSFRSNDSVLIFASGVSNSGELGAEAYKRERHLLLAQKKSFARLVYFSTCSVFDSSLSATPYIIHKKAIEKLITENFDNYLLIRLPILVGKTSNPNTFFNFIKNKIIKNESFLVHKNAWRNLFDVDDLSRFLTLYLNQYSSGKEVLNAAFDNNASVIQIVKSFENILGKQAKTQLVDTGSKYDFDKISFLNFLEKNDVKYEKDNYNDSVLRKYLS